MKITQVRHNNRGHRFDVEAEGRNLSYPYALLELRPGRGNLVAESWVDQELGDEAFSYRLRDGSEGCVHLDHVLEFNRDPDYMAELLVYKLSLAIRERLQGSGISQREMIRRLGTSPSQYYRLLDPANTTKSVGQMLGILHLLGCDVDLVIRDLPKPGARSAAPAR